MQASRGKKGKRTGWQLVLGVKEVIFAGLGVAGLMMMTFALGTLAGRGDIYRILSNWGLLAPEPAKLVQPWSGPGVSPAAAPAPREGSPRAASPVPEPGASASVVPPPPVQTLAEPAAAPVKGSLAGLPGPAAASKKTKSGTLSREQRAREEELRRLRREVASKLKFQNSLETGSWKPARPAPKPKLASAKQVKVAQFRDAKAARVRLAELRKKGEKVTIKQGKDKKGVYYVIYRQSPAPAGEAKTVAQKEKRGESPPKPPAGR
jgi:hypothetical protein